MGIKKSKCFKCSLCCEISFIINNEKIEGIKYERNNSLNEGRLCQKGNELFYELDFKERLTRPFYNGNFISHNEAEKIFIDEIKNKKNKGILINDFLSDEICIEILNLKKLLNYKIFLTNNFVSNKNNYEIKLEELYKKENINYQIIFGDLFIEHPIIAKKVLQMKYNHRDNQIITFTKEKCKTEWFANTKFSINEIDNFLKQNELIEKIKASVEKIIYISGSINDIKILEKINELNEKINGRKIKLNNTYLSERDKKLFEKEKSEMNEINEMDLLIIFGLSPIEIKIPKIIISRDIILNEKALFMPSAHYLEENGSYNNYVIKKIKEPISGVYTKKEILKLLENGK